MTVKKLSRHLAKCGLPLALIASAFPAYADSILPDTASQGPVVIELYTSQGCVSCPPADEYMAELVKDPRLLPLALHVDYWDYIGWQDHFAKPEYTERQKSYAKAVGSRTIYTPQFIVSGENRIEGHSPEMTKAAIDAALLERKSIKLQAERKGDILTIRAEADPPLDQPVRVHLVRYISEQTVEIERGENAGKTVTYHNIVSDWQLLGDWIGDDNLDVDVPITGTEEAAVLLQKLGPAKIVAASLVPPELP